MTHKWARREPTFLLEAIALATLILGPAVAFAIVLDMEHGNIAEWVAGIGAVGALIAAVFAARSASRTFARELDREHRAQAEKVSAWGERAIPTAVDAEDASSPTSDPPDTVWFELRSALVRLRNVSELPVTNVKVSAQIRLDDDQGSAVYFGRAKTQPVLPPGADTTIVVDADVPFDTRRFRGLSGSPLNRLVVQLRFTDSAGTQWERAVPGNLEPYVRP